MILYHSCGRPFFVADYDGCDVVEGNCPQCSKLVVLSGTGEHTYDLQDLVRALRGWHEHASPKTFAALRDKYHTPWDALRLTQLIRAIADGADPNLSWSDPDTVQFRKAKAKQILALPR